MAVFTNYDNNKIVRGTSSADNIYSSGIKVTISGGNGNDTIENRGYDVKINAGAGNDSVWTDVLSSYGSSNYRSATVNGGEGNDTLKVRDNQTSLNGGAGNDLISVYSSGWENNTLQGGKGNDIIYGGGSNIFVYADGDGNDTIYYAYSGDTIQIAANNGYTSKKSGNDLIIKVGSGKMTFKDGANKSFNISTVPSAKKTQQDVIKAFMHSLDETSLSGTAALDEAVKYASSGKFKTYNALIKSFVSDCKKYSVDKFLKNYCGINLSNKDTGAITGWDAGGLVVKTAESIIEESGKLQPYKSSFTLTHPESGLILVWNEPDNVTAAQRKIVQGLYSWWFKGALDLVTESYGLDFKKSDTVKKITLDFDLNNSETGKGKLAETFSTYYKEIGKTFQLDLWINDEVYSSLNLEKNKDGKAPDSVIDVIYNFFYRHGFSGQYLDATLAHEFTHAIMSANITHHSDLPKLIKEGMSELTIGTDKIRDVKTLANTFHSKNSSKLETSLKGGMSGETDDAYTSGYMLLRYFAKQVSNVPEGVHCDSDKTKILLTSDYTGTTFNAEDYFSTIKEIDGTSLKSKVKLVGNSLANTINGSTKDDTLLGGAGADSIYGKAGNDLLGGGDDKDILSGGSGNDTLWGDAGNDSLSGGKDKDVLVGGIGNDTLWGDSGDDVLAGWDGKDILIGGSGNDSLWGDAGNDSLSDGNDNDLLDGGDGADTLRGGTGNDSLWGNAGADTFIYGKGDGQDIIYGFDKTDLLQITGTFSASYSKAKKEIYFDVGTTTNAITLKDFGSTASFNVNGTNYKISGTKLIKK